MTSRELIDVSHFCSNNQDEVDENIKRLKMTQTQHKKNKTRLEST